MRNNVSKVERLYSFLVRHNSNLSNTTVDLHRTKAEISELLIEVKEWLNDERKVNEEMGTS